MARSAFTYRWVLSVAALVLAGPLFALGAAGRGEVLGTGAGLAIGCATTIAAVKYLDHRIDRRRRSGAVVHAPTVAAVRLRHGLEPVSQDSLPDWLSGLRAFEARANRIPVHPVEWLARGHELVVMIGSIDSGVEVGDLVVVRRLPVDLAGFRLWPRWRFDERAGRSVGDLYRIQPDGAEVPPPLADWLRTDRPRIELDVTGHWCAVREHGGRQDPLTGVGLETSIDDLVSVADHVAAVVGP